MKISKRKLNYEKAQEIRERYFSERVKQKDLAVEYGVTPSAINKIISERLYPAKLSAS